MKFALMNINAEGQFIYWSAVHGWVADWRNASHYTDTERDTALLPADSRVWIAVPKGKPAL